MNFKTNILGHLLHYTVSEKGVHLYCDTAFYSLMERFPRKGIEILSIAMKRDFEKVNARKFDISQRSITIEIWGHFYFEQIFNKFKWILQNPITLKLKERLLTATDEIDVGEYGYDNNRWIWNSLVPFYTIIMKGIRDQS